MGMMDSLRDSEAAKDNLRCGGRLAGTGRNLLQTAITAKNDTARKVKKLIIGAKMCSLSQSNPTISSYMSTFLQYSH